MNSLNFPPFDYRLKKIDDRPYIFDTARQRYVLLTPEEWVRQHLVHFLVDHRGYPEQLIAIEKEIDVCGLRQRFDVVCHHRDGLPCLVAECKAPTVTLTPAAFEQASRYNIVLAARRLLVTNGHAHLCWEGGELLDGIPFYAAE
ncbi:MAG: type I restriction enzyme HsdR N-terminal domain-containing protein [Odoribacteraceae bacterium]|jgi:hypothetical protein|nr:type I restriction enzyme HsdR N-terminal domain-containing protein [Odoribacteraceae bacterium]